uniref:Pumilio/Puf RNA-binding domain-containing family protein n=4 Tax=Populus TaxID=3689 RepID=A0A4U5R214_POPAL|nr:pumilio homolog 23 [Populus alba]XP_034900231.1 pumilio homolog 23 [Populus alba]TKS15455.1 pumilio/Puf RNA-binding domain-containing family protein [Populus alba]
MVSVGSKALASRRDRTCCNLVEDNLMGREDKSYNQGRKKKGMGRKAKNDSFGFDADNSNKSVSGRATDGAAKPKKSSKYQNTFSEPQPSIVRKQVDPETTKYFSEIVNLFESDGVDLEERPVICGNALEEARGKEFELATDYYISHTLQILLEGCNVDHLCDFLRGCAKVFPLISMDRSGSHVAETALKSLAMHLQDDEAYSVIEETLTNICKVIVASPVDMMCNCYGSHVFRSLLCLCGGVPLDSPVFHRAKPSMILAERLNLSISSAPGNNLSHHHQGFPGLLKFLVSGMLNCSEEDVKYLLVDQYSSLVFQTALKLFAGHDQQLLQIIPVLLDCRKENLTEGNFIEMTAVGDIVELMKEAAYSHLMEVILAVSPESLYDEMFTKIFRKSLFELSSHQCGNFVVQALVSHARDREQMEFIWEKLGPKFRDLLEMGKSGVIASLIATSQRLHTHEHEVCKALADAVCLPNESPRSVVDRILFLESYFACVEKSNWKWPSGAKIHVMGSLILQAVFKFQNQLIQPYIMSLTSMEVDHVLEAAKDVGGARTIEAFLDSDASGKQKHRLINKLRGHFGELAMHSSGSFTVEKCFSASNLSLREAIASDLLSVQNELPKTKQGPYLLRKLDIDGYANRPDQWRSRQASKQSTYKEFYAAFGSGEAKSSKSDSFLADTSKSTSLAIGVKNVRKEIDHHLASSEKYAKHAVVDDVMKVKNKKHEKGHGGASDEKATGSVNQKPFLSVDLKKSKRHGQEERSKASRKKLKV